MTNADVARAFNDIANLLEFKGEDAFRVGAYRRVARTVAELQDDIKAVNERGELATLPGIGEASAERIQELLTTGKLALRTELALEVPETLLRLLEVPTLGPKKIALLWNERGIRSMEDLKAAIDNGTLAGLKGFGAKSIEHVQRGVEFLERSAGLTRLGDAWRISTQIREAVLALPGVQHVARSGALRRGCETVRGLDMLCVAEEPAPIIRQFVKQPGIKQVLAVGNSWGSVMVDVYSGHSMQVALRVVPEKTFGAAWQYFTGNGAHNNRLRELAARRGWTLSEHGLISGKRVIAARTEEEIYSELNVPWIPPEMREDKGELSLDEVPADLVSVERMRGDMHMHTVASDGRNTLEEMAVAARERGYQYICITEHSQSSAIAGGLKPERLLQHIAEIRALQAQMEGIIIFAGTEVDILADGTLDYPDELLAKLDFVVASIHFGLGYDIESNTRRTLAAMHNPFVNCIGHPTGRLINERDSIPLDIDAVCREAVRTGTALEINANYYRLDLRDQHARVARDHGATLIINTDAHALEQLDQMHFGVLTARRAWLRDHDVLNTRTAKEVGHFVALKRMKRPQPTAAS
jgi:DNA polymerase (family 10)